jgi:ferrochelatase
MTPRDFLRHYEFDDRIIRGRYYQDAPLEVEEGETVGVVMMNVGGPAALEDVKPFLYNLFMDPALLDVPLGTRLRHWLCKTVAHVRAKSVTDDYEMIGGGSPINRLTREQARGLQRHLNDVYGRPSGVEFRTYTAMRYWHPFSEEAAAEMEADGVDRVVLLPLYPQWSKTTSGSSVAYWKALEETGEIPTWPTTSVYEYAANPKYVQAVSERIDEALQRFPSSVRPDVHLLFSAHGTPLREMTERQDPYCCLVHSTVQQVMALRSGDRSFHTAFQSKVGPSEWLSPSTPQTVDALAEQGARGVLVVPIAFVTDHIETSYELDIEMRERAAAAGISHFEVTSGLNSHPLLLEALGEATVAHLQLPVNANQLRFGGDGLDTYPLRPPKELPFHSADDRDVRCPNCQCVTEARQWDVPPDVPTPELRSTEAEDTDC